MTDRDPTDWDAPVPREELEPHAESDPMLQGMLARNLPLTRNQWLKLAYGADEPERWNAEHELGVPEPFRDETAVDEDA